VSSAPDQPGTVTHVIAPAQLAMLDLAKELVGGGNERGLSLRALGGVGVAFQCPTAMRPPLARAWKDLDFVAVSGQRQDLEAYLDSRGLQGDREFNALHGRQRLNYVHEEHGYDIDIFIDRLVMCHTLDLSDRLGRHELTLDPADLLLTKLQVVETNDRDYRDIAAILCDHDVEHDRIVGLLSREWCWWRTATQVLERSATYARELPDFPERERMLESLTSLQDAIESAPKSLGWRMRARIGDRVRWYELPEEDEGGI
jgi:hypothetical protein